MVKRKACERGSQWDLFFFVCLVFFLVYELTLTAADV